MTIAQMYLAGLLALMAVAQLVSWREYVPAISAYGVSHPRWWAIAIVAGEAAAAILLVPAATRLAGGVLALLVALLWSGLAIKAFIERRRIKNCGCFGGFLAQRLRWWVLLEDAAFIGLAAWVIHQSAGSGG